jgi:DNA-binding LacI/PurR family transcriptional regulator
MESFLKSEVSPTVRVTIEAIRKNIRSGVYRADSALPSEASLANSLSVSRGTVRRAIEALVSAGDLKRRPYSRPTIEARKSRGPVTGSEVQVWVSHPIADGASLQFLRGISSGLMGTNYRVVVREPCRFYADFVKIEEREFLTDLLANENAVGAIIERDPFAENDEVYAQLIGSGKHLVFVDIAPPEGLEADHVGTANLASARKCVSHLLDLGHTHIHFVTDTDIPDTIKDRERGYWRAMRSAGVADFGKRIVAEELPRTSPNSKLPIGPFYSRILSKSPNYSDWAQRIVCELLASDPMPTALFICCDVLAYWVCAYLEGAGIHIPEDMSIVGFDWIGRWDDPANDVLTTASQDFEGLGTHAAELLLDRLSDGVIGPPCRVLLPAALVVKNSTAPELAAPASAARENGTRMRIYR